MRCTGAPVRCAELPVIKCLANRRRVELMLLFLRFFTDEKKACNNAESTVSSVSGVASMVDISAFE